MNAVRWIWPEELRRSYFLNKQAQLFCFCTSWTKISLSSTSCWLLAPFTPWLKHRSDRWQRLCCAAIHMSCAYSSCVSRRREGNGGWPLPPGNYITPPAEEATSSCGQRDSPSPLPDTRLRWSPALRSCALFPLFVPSSHRPAAPQWRPWAALSLLQENFWGRITKRSVSRGEMTRLWLMSFTPTHCLSAGLTLCRHICQVLFVKISLNTHSREISLSRLCNVLKSLAELPHQSRLSGTVISCSS